MLEVIPEPPKNVLMKARVTPMTLDGNSQWAGVSGTSDITQEAIEWWVSVAPKAKYLLRVRDGNSYRELSLADGVSAMCLVQSGDLKRLTPLLPVDDEDTEILLIYLSQKGINVPWNDLYKESRNG